jgi:hypothetical protein
MPLEQSFWIPRIQLRLFPKNDFLGQSVDESAYVNYKTVIRPIQGTRPTVMLDATGEQSEGNSNDTESSYNLHNLRTKAILVEDIQEIERSYDLTGSIIDRKVNELNLKGANYIAHKWSPNAAANIIRTTGTSKETVALNGTGGRLKMTLTDFSKCVGMLDDMDLPEEGRNALMPSAWYRQLLEDEKSLLLNLAASGKATLVDGELMMLFGVRIWRRGRKNIPLYDNVGTPQTKSPFAVGAASDNATSLFWHKDCVGKALGDIKMYDAPNAKAQGFDISARVRASGSPIFDDLTGVIALVEKAG